MIRNKPNNVCVLFACLFSLFGELEPVCLMLCIGRLFEHHHDYTLNYKVNWISLKSNIFVHDTCSCNFNMKFRIGGLMLMFVFRIDIKQSIVFFFSLTKEQRLCQFFKEATMSKLFLKKLIK